MTFLRRANFCTRRSRFRPVQDSILGHICPEVNQNTGGFGGTMSDRAAGGRLAPAPRESRTETADRKRSSIAPVMANLLAEFVPLIRTDMGLAENAA